PGLIDRRWNALNQEFQGDGEIDLLDFLPIMLNLESQVSAWTVYYSSADQDYLNHGSWQVTVPYAQHLGDRATQQIWYEWAPPVGLQTGHYWVVPVWEDQVGFPSNLVQIH